MKLRNYLRTVQFILRCDAVEFVKHDAVFQRNKLTLLSLHKNIEATDSSETLVHIYQMYAVISQKHAISY
jgi:hypothetical protein